MGGRLSDRGTFNGRSKWPGFDSQQEGPAQMHAQELTDVTETTSPAVERAISPFTSCCLATLYFEWRYTPSETRQVCANRDLLYSEKYPDGRVTPVIAYVSRHIFSLIRLNRNIKLWPTWPLATYMCQNFLANFDALKILQQRWTNFHNFSLLNSEKTCGGRWD